MSNATVMKRMLGAIGERIDASRETVDELQLKQLHLLKIDDPATVEEVLQGARDTLWRLRPLLFIRVGDGNALTERVSETKDFGYRCWKIETPLFNLANFNRRETDIFAGETALALLAAPEEVEGNLSLPECREI